MGKIWPKKWVTLFFIINPLKGRKKPNLAKNYNFPVIFFLFIGISFGVKKNFLADEAHISMNIRLFRDKYYIKTPKNHWRLNTGHCLTISHFGELDMAYLSNNGPGVKAKTWHKISKDKVSGTLKSRFRLFWAKLSIKTDRNTLFIQ